MQELQNIRSTVHPHEILLVIDAMTGQDAVNVAKSFNETPVSYTHLDVYKRQVMRILKNVDDIEMCRFTQKAVVRHRLVQEIIKAYEKYESEDKK